MSFECKGKESKISNLVKNSQPRYMIIFLFFKQSCGLKCFVVIFLRWFTLSPWEKMCLLAKRKNKREH